MAKKYALLIGNNQYHEERLQTLNASINDIEALQRVLKHPDICAFDEVKVLANPSLKESMRELSVLFSEKTRDDLVLFYFSGHGVKDHACELFFAIKETEWGLYDGTAIAASQLKSIAHKSASRRQVLILDCCHSGAIANAGFKGTEQFISEDMFDVKGYGREIITATDSLQYAMDGGTGLGDEQHSLFTRCLIEGLETGEAAPAGAATITVEDLYQYVHQRVKAEQPAMTPRHWCDRSEGRINLAKNPRPVFILPDDLLNDLQHHNVRTRMGALHEIEVMLREGSIAQGQAAVAVLIQRKQEERDRFVYQRIESLLGSHASESQHTNDVQRVSSAKPDRNKQQPGGVFRDPLKDGSQGPEMIIIPGGKFRMGDSQDTGRDNEKPVHDLIIKQAFALGKYPVTFKEYDNYCEQTNIDKPEDKAWGRDKRPLINVSWEDAVAYTQWLSAETGKRYRLPSEAEWEYAARAGTHTAYWWGDKASKEYANYASKKTTPVDQYQPNAFGLHDMLGNVWEWVEDCWHDSYQDKPMQDSSAWVADACEARVLRGGSWNDRSRYVRSANRDRSSPLNRVYNVGFRLAQDL